MADLDSTASNSMKSVSKHGTDFIRLNVGGQHFMTTRATLTKQKNSMLAKMFDENLGMKPSHLDGTEAYLIDRDPTYFRVILNYLRDGELTLDSEVSLEGVRKEARYFGVEGIDNVEAIPTGTVRLNIDGKHVPARMEALEKIKKNKIDFSKENMDETGAYYLFRDAEGFKDFLKILHGHHLKIKSGTMLDRILTECSFFGVEFDFDRCDPPQDPLNPEAMVLEVIWPACTYPFTYLTPNE